MQPYQSQIDKLIITNNDDRKFTFDLTPRDKNFLKRLPSVRHRNIDIQQTSDKNEVVVLRDGQDKILLLTYYHNFGDFVYAHTTIGKDEYKDFFWRYFVEITTELAPIYSVLYGSDESISITEKYGGREVYIDQVERNIPDFLRRVNELTGRSFFRNGDILMDKDDEIPVKNPLFHGTKDDYINSLKKLNDEGGGAI